MKRFLFFAIAALTLVTLTTSCEKKFKITYDFNITGRASGDVAVTFPGGSVDLDGNANLLFKYGNLDTVSLNQPKLSMQETKQIYSLADEEVFSQFEATTEAGGTYYLLVDCVAKEELTGAEIRWKKVLTNEPQK